MSQVAQLLPCKHRDGSKQRANMTMTELEQLHNEKVRELERIYAREATGEDLRMRRKELEQEVETLWALVAGEIKRRHERRE